MRAKHKQTIPKMKHFILKVSEWHTSLFLTSHPLPPPLYFFYFIFFLDQKYSGNVFEFVNHFDSPSPLTFTGKFTLCQNNCSASSSQLLQSPVLLESFWTGLVLKMSCGHATDAPGVQAELEGKPQHLCRQLQDLCHKAALKPPRFCLKKPWATLSRDQTGSQPLREATTQTEFLNEAGLASW